MRNNYRIYDGTGGGAEEDIFAASLEEAITKGREWIEAGDWERDEYETPLDCCVREIVYAELGEDDLYHRATRRDDSVYHLDEDGDLVDEDGNLLGIDVGAIDDDATVDEYDHDCSGFRPAADAPDCDDDQEHDWQSPYEVVGGCKENPGVLGSDHGKVKITEVCANCGLYRTTDYGATNSSNGTCVTRISYRDADEKSLAWVAENKPSHEDESGEYFVYNYQSGVQSNGWNGPYKTLPESISHALGGSEQPVNMDDWSEDLEKRFGDAAEIVGFYGLAESEDYSVIAKII